MGRCRWPVGQAEKSKEMDGSRMGETSDGGAGWRPNGRAGERATIFAACPKTAQGQPKIWSKARVPGPVAHNTCRGLKLFLEHFALRISILAAAGTRSRGLA